MRKVGSRELKNRMGRYLLAVRQGQTLIVTDRGKPVAKLSPTNDAKSQKMSLRERLEELEAQGLIRLGKGRLKKFRAVKSRGKPASQMIIEDRD
jgi:prevent-host-death family protein